LVGFEIIKRLYVTPQLFSEENGTLTPTLKIKRYAAKKLYQDAIDELYSEPFTVDVTKTTNT
jgi:long-chain acyl-CoA synthetase